MPSVGRHVRVRTTSRNEYKVATADERRCAQDQGGREAVPDGKRQRHGSLQNRTRRRASGSLSVHGARPTRIPVAASAEVAGSRAPRRFLVAIGRVRPAERQHAGEERRPRPATTLDTTVAASMNTDHRACGRAAPRKRRLLPTKPNVSGTPTIDSAAAPPASGRQRHRLPKARQTFECRACRSRGRWRPRPGTARPCSTRARRDTPAPR